MKRIIYIAIAMVFILRHICLAQENLEALDAAPKTGGTRALSMGGVYIATNQGIDALSGNPGGLALLDGIQISVTGSVQIYGKSDFDDTYYSYYIAYSSKFEPLFKFTNIGIAVPITIPKASIKLAGAAGYRRFYDWSRRKVVEKEYDYYENGIVHSKETYKTHGLINVLSLGIGTTMSKKWSFGFSVNFPIWKNYENESEINDIYSDKIYKSNTQEERNVSADCFIQLGGILQVTSKLAAGVSCLMKHGFTLQNVKRKSHYNGDVYSYEIDDKNKWEIPGTIDFGISYKLRPNLLLAADIQSRPWENIRINDLPIDDVKNGNVYRFGLEFERKVLFRAGFSWERLPLLDADEHPVDLKNTTAGIGYQSKDFILDLGLSYKFVTFETQRWGEKWKYHIREFVIHTTLRHCF